MRKQCSDSDAKIAKLQQDNVGLFERIKFLQHYQRDSKASLLEQRDSASSRQQVGPVSAAL